MIRPELDPPPPDLIAQWQTHGIVRVERFFRDEVAEEALRALREAPHHLTVPTRTDLAYLMASSEHRADPTSGSPLARMVAWWFTEGRAWVTALTGHDLVAPPSGVLLSTLYTKGCYLEPHNDQAPSRVLAFILGFTAETWEPSEGGYLEFLDTDASGQLHRTRRAPGFNTLDLFDVREGAFVHEIPILRTHRERRVMSGWFHRPGTTVESAGHLTPYPSTAAGQGH